jgi:hypothetical protein
MKKVILLFMTSLIIMSCNSQSIDLELLKFDQQIPESVLNIKKIKEDTDVTYGLSSYRTDELQNFKFGDITFSKYSVPNGFDDAYSEIYVHVDNYKENKYLGFSISIANEKEGIALLNYFKKKYGKPEERDKLGNSTAFVWELKDSKQWVLLVQNIFSTRDNKRYLQTDLTIVKQDLRVQNTTNVKWLTILESFNATNGNKKK